MGRILYGLANHDLFALPLHVYGKWHPRHNPDADYVAFRTRATRAQFLYTEGNPTLAAWRPVQWIHGQREHMERARDLHTDEVAAIPLGAAYRVWGASTRLGNIPEDVSFGETHGAWGRPLTHEQIFIRQNTRSNSRK